MSPLNRRLFMIGLAGAPLLSQTSALGALARSETPFSLGVASGEPGTNSVVLWTRLAPAPLEPDAGLPQVSIPVQWEIFADEALRIPVQKGVAVADPGWGHAVHVLVTGLEPDRYYWYRFIAMDSRSDTGRTKTLPGASATRLRIASAGCQSITWGYFTAWAEIARSELDFVFHYGDYIYETRLNDGIHTRIGRNVPQGMFRQPRNLSQYRQRYALYKLDPDLQRAHAAHPFVSTYDDHEVVNDWAGDFAPGMDQESFLARRAAALQAYYENMPIMPPHRTPGSSSYRAFNCGSLATLCVLDTRLFRTGPACGTTELANCPERTDPRRSIMGQAQEEWLSRRLSESRTTWNIICQQVAMMKIDLSKDDSVQYSMDKWDGYSASRDRLFDTVSRVRPSGFVVLTGDFHASVAGELRRDFDDTKTPSFGVEFIATSVSSQGDNTKSKKAVDLVKRHNPSIDLFDGKRGYVECDFTKSRLEARFRTIDVVSSPGAPIKSLITYIVDPRNPRLT